MSVLLDFDHSFFWFIFSKEPIFFWDQFFVVVTSLNKNKPFMLGLLTLLLVLAYRKKQWNGVLAVVLIGVWISAADIIGGQFLKPSFERMRPYELFGFEPKYHSGGGSFPSNHATNMFCLSVLMAPIFKRKSWMLFLFAGLVAYSRVHLGVHFPSDVVAGALWGSLWGLFGLVIWNKIQDVKARKS